MKKSKSLKSGAVYFVIKGRNKGKVGIALSANDWGHEYDGSTLFSPVFARKVEDDGYVSFLGVTERLRLATEKEELEWRREWQSDIPTVPAQW